MESNVNTMEGDSKPNKRGSILVKAKMVLQVLLKNSKATVANAIRCKI